MNIKEAIERGLYPTDDKGRALVPTASTRYSLTTNVCATIVCVDKPGHFCLMGWVPTNARAAALSLIWDADGECCGEPAFNLLAPPPRKVPLKGYAVIAADGTHWSTHGNARDASAMIAHSGNPTSWSIVELTGEWTAP